MENNLVNQELKKTKKSNFLKYFFTIAFCFGSITCILGIFLLYGPFYGFRDWLITTAYTTMSHKYLATYFFDEETINDCMNRNKITEAQVTTNIELINFKNNIKNSNIKYANEYEEAILKRDEKNNDYKIIKIKEEKYTGLLAVIYDASRVKTVVSSNLGTKGEYLTQISKKNNSLVAINAGGFLDENFKGTGGAPLGITISDGKFLSKEAYNAYGRINWI